MFLLNQRGYSVQKALIQISSFRATTDSTELSYVIKKRLVVAHFLTVTYNVVRSKMKRKISDKYEL